MRKTSAANLFIVFAAPTLVLVWFMTAINGMWSYLFDGLLNVNSPSITLMLLAAISILIFNSFWGNKDIFTGGIGTFALYFVFLTYLIFATIIQSTNPAQNTLVTIFTFTVLYLHIFLIWISPVYSEIVPKRSGTILILLVALAMALAGSAQHFTGDFFHFGQYIISKVGSTNSTADGLVRANAFFKHGDDLGIFLSFAAGICTSAAVIAKSVAQRILLLLTLVILGVGCYATLTRTAYLSFFLSVTLAYWISRRGSFFSQKILTFIPVALLVLGIFIYHSRFIIEHILVLFGLGDRFSFLTSSESLEDRLSITSYYLKHVNDAGVTGWLFGLGWAFRSNPLATLPIDNGYLATLLTIGLIGLTLWVLLMWVIWISLINHRELSNQPLLIGAAAFFAQFLFLNVFGTHLEPQTYIIYTIMCSGLPLLMRNYSAKKN